MWWLITVAILVVIGLLPLHLRLRYNDSGFRLWLRIFLFRIPLIPAAEKKEKKKSKKADKTAGKTNTAGHTKKIGGNISAFLPYVENLLDFLTELPRRLTVRNLELTLILANADPCDLAVNYGRTWTALGNLMPRLEALLRIRKRELKVECDFAGEETKVYFDMDIALTVGRLVCMLIFHGSRILRKYIMIMNK